MNFLFRIFCVSIFLSSFSSAESLGTAPLSSCALRFESDSTGGTEDGTQALISYLEDLLRQDVFKGLHLERLLDGLEKGEIKNPILPSEALASSNLSIQRDTLEEHLQLGGHDLEKLKEWVIAKLEKITIVKSKRSKTREKTKSDFLKIQFHPVSSGSFLAGRPGKKTPVTLTHPFEMMSTPVTQSMWAERMGENPSHFIEGSETRVVSMGGKEIRMQPDHPVENITWWSAVVFANRLSVEKGLKPVYDLSDVQFKTNTRAEDGTLAAKAKYKNKIKINAPNGDIYLAEGFRLPTEAEFEYMLRARGRANGTFYFLESEQNAKKYAWTRENSSGGTRAVAELLPMMVEGMNGAKDFYDLLGNVWEWIQDWYSEEPISGVNPKGPSIGRPEINGVLDPDGTQAGSSRVMRGSSWNNEASLIGSYTERNRSEPGSRCLSLGFRLVRTLK